MYPTICVGLIAVFLAYLNGKSTRDNCLKLSFLLLTIFLSLSYNWGPDVSSYYDTFIEVNSSEISIFDFSSLFGLRKQGEVGWSILNIISFPIGFFGFRFLLFSIENFILYRLIKDFVNKKWQWFAVFIYVFNAPEFMVIGSTMMRQWLAMCLVVGAFLLYKHGHLLYAAIVLLITPTIHASAFISFMLIPLLFIKYDFSKTKIIAIVILLVFSITWFVKNLAPEIISAFLIGGFDFYELYLDQTGGQGSGIVATMKMLLYIALFLSINQVEQKDRFFIAVAFVSILFLPLQSFGQLVIRLSYYYSIFTIVALPQFFSQVKWNNLFKTGALCFLFILYIYGFWIHFTGPVFHDTMYEYHSIFEAGKWM